MATNEQRREAAKRKLEAQQARRAEREQKRKRNTTIAAVVTVLVVVLAAVGIYALTSAWGGPDDATPPAAAAPAGDGPDTSGLPTVALPKRPTALPASVDCTYPRTPEPAAKPVNPPAAGATPAQGTVTANLQTSAGPIDLTLDRDLAPCTVKSFENLARQGYFDGTSCHRLTTSPGLQVLQCGDPSGSGSGGPGYSFADEVFPGLTYGRGLLAMANAGPNTNGSQFFMIYGDAQLPPNYTVFGSIGQGGLKVLDSVARKGHDGSLDPSPGGGKPVDPVTIERTSITS